MGKNVNQIKQCITHYFKIFNLDAFQYLLFKMFLDILLFCGLIIIIDYFRRLHLTQTVKNIPIVSRIPFIGTMIALSSLRPDNFIEMWRKYVMQYGKSFYGITLNRIVLVTTDHRIVDILLGSQDHLHKNQLYKMLDSWLGSGLLVSSGKTWQVMRKVITPTFHFKVLEQFIEVFDRQADVFIQKLNPLADGQRAVNIFQPVGLLTMDIIAESAMGVTINAQMDSKSEFVQSVNEVTEIIANRFVRPHLSLNACLKLFAPKQYNTQKKCIKVMHEFTEKIIAERHESLRKASINATDSTTNNIDEDMGIKKRLALLDVLLQSTMDDGKPIPDKQIRDEVNTFMFEGHDTTTSAISFCLYALSRHGKIQKKLFEEIRQHFGDDLSRPVTYSDLQQLVYLNCVIKESLRLYPPVPAIGRWLSQDFTVDDCTLPAGTNIIVILLEMLRDPEIFEDPFSFKPERHLCNNAKVNAYSNIPFSAGPRNCIGQKFALFEMRTVLTKVLRHYELLPMGEEVQLSVTIVLRSRNGVQLGLRPRSYN